MRTRADPAFSEYILRIGNGFEQEDEAEHIKLLVFLALQPTEAIPALDQLIDFVFPTIAIGNLDLISSSTSAILAPKNQAVDEINEVIISKFPGTEHLHLSFDETSDVAQ